MRGSVSTISTTECFVLIIEGLTPSPPPALRPLRDIAGTLPRPPFTDISGRRAIGAWDLAGVCKPTDQWKGK
jgi:hypothetical protein